MRAAALDLPHTTPMNQIRGFVSRTKETASVLDSQEALLSLGASSDLLNIDSHLIERPEAVNMPLQFDQGSLLHVAAMRGHYDLAEMLIHRRGAAVDRPNYAQQTSLHAASEGNYGDIVTELLCAGADADKRDCLKQTPLHRAAHCGSIDAMLALLECGANTKLRDEGGLLAIHKAALMGRDEAIRILLERDPDTINVEAADGWMPSHFAGHGGHAAALEVLVAHGADLTAVDSERMTPLHRVATSGSQDGCQVLLRAGSDLDVRCSQHRLPIHLACEEGSTMITRILLEAGSPLEVLDGLRRTPLLIAVQAASASPHADTELVELLLSWGADATHGNPAKGMPSPMAVARRGSNPTLRGLLEEYATAVSQEQEAED